jgi:hypothetical protein
MTPKQGVTLLKRAAVSRPWSTFDKALDGTLATFFDASISSGA